jgi:hypothetical protein
MRPDVFLDTGWRVCISRDASGTALPRWDLRLSPKHAIYYEYVLISMRHLISELTIGQEYRRIMKYYHIELTEYNTPLAEGLPCESFLDAGNKDQFSNGGSVMRLHPELVVRIWEAAGHAPLVMHGQRVDAAREFLARRAAEFGLVWHRRPRLGGWFEKTWMVCRRRP